MNTKPPRFVRFAVLAGCGAALVWLAGCGGGSEESLPAEEPAAPRVSLAEQMEQRNAAIAAKKQQAAADAIAAEREALANEPPTVIVQDDFKAGKKLENGGYLSTSLRAGIVAKQRLGMIQMQKAMSEFNALEDRYPESQEEFDEKIIKRYGIELEELDGPYDYQYNPEDHQLYKVPSLEKFDAGVRKTHRTEAE